jgi:shikimate dehydrogenase
VLHNAAYAELGLDWRYQLYPAPTIAEFDTLIAEMAVGRSAIAGLNVTTPYKAQAFAAAATLDRAASLTGSVNVLTVGSDNRGQAILKGSNTDGLGLVRSLQNDAVLDLQGSSAVICGTGPVATTTALALLDAEVGELTILSRSLTKAQSFVETIHAQAGGLNAAAYDTAQANALIAHAVLIIDATTLGMHPGDPSPIDTTLLHSGQVAIDLVYGHGTTAFIAGARAAGAQAFDGLGMLVEQAALTIEIWAGEQGLNIKAPRAAMHKAVDLLY